MEEHGCLFFANEPGKCLELALSRPARLAWARNPPASPERERWRAGGGQVIQAGGHLR